MALNRSWLYIGHVCIYRTRSWFHSSNQSLNDAINPEKINKYWNESRSLLHIINMFVCNYTWLYVCHDIHNSCI